MGAITKLRLLIIAIILTGLCLLGTSAWYRLKYISLRNTAYQTLTDLAKNRVADITQYLTKQQELAQKIANEKQLKTFFSKEKKSNHKEIANFFSHYKKQLPYERILLIDPEGKILFSSRSEKEAGRNIMKFGFQHTGLGESFQRVTLSLVPDVAEFSIDPVFKEASLFLLTPVLDNKKIIGVLVCQIDEKQVYKLIRKYARLGATGETIIGKRIPEGVLMISPSRHAPEMAFKQQGSFAKEQNIAMQRAVLAQVGVGKGKDYRNEPVLAAWSYIPIANWGIIVKQDMSEVYASLKLIRFLIFFLLIILIILIIFFIRICFSTFKLKIPFISSLKSSSLIRYTMWFLLLCSALLFTILYWNTHKKSSALLEKTKNLAQQKVEESTDQIKKELLKIDTIAHTIADDLKEKRLHKEDLFIRLKRDLSEHANLTQITVAYKPYAYKEDIKLYAPTVVRKNGKIIEENIENEYDYTQQEARSEWYTKTIESGPQWSNPIFDSQIKDAIGVHTIPFFQSGNQAAGVIAITYKLAPIVATARVISIGETGYAFIVNKNGTFLYHPVIHYIQDQKTLNDIAEEQANEELRLIAEQIRNNKTSIDSYKDNNTHQTMWLSFGPTEIANWKFGVSFSQQEVLLEPKIIRRLSIWILICFLLFLLMGTGLLYKIEALSNRSLEIGSLASSIILAAGLLALWYIIMQTNYPRTTENIIVSQQAVLDKLINEEQQDARRKNEPVPIPISTGLFIYSLSFPDPDHIAFSARIWQIYTEIKNKKISYGVQIPQAQQLEIDTILNNKEKSDTTIAWKVQAVLPQQHDYTPLPFDIHRIIIPLEHVDITQNIMLVPDLASYTSLVPQNKPGIDKNLLLPGFTIKETFFSLEPDEPATTFGIESYGQVTGRTKLTYNIIASRNLLNPIIIYFLPLLVVLFSLFAIFWLTTRKHKHLEATRSTVFRALSAYTGLFFALIILHRTLRTQYPVGDVLYIEYFFFYAYLTILLFTCYAVFLYTGMGSEKIRSMLSEVLALVFWPIQLTLWFITTVWVFY